MPHSAQFNLAFMCACTSVHPSRLGLTWRCQTQAGINHHLQFPRGGARAAALAHHNPPCRPSLHLCCRPRPRCRPSPPSITTLATRLSSAYPHVLRCVTQVACWQRPKAEVRLPHRRARREVVKKAVALQSARTRLRTVCAPAQPSHAHMMSWCAAVCAGDLRAGLRCIEQPAAAASRQWTRVIHFLCALLSRLSFLMCASMQCAECADGSSWAGWPVCGCGVDSGCSLG